MRRASAVVRDGVRARLWPLPAGAVVVAVVAGVVVPHGDARVDARLPEWFAGVIFGGDAGAARTVLQAVSGSLITVTALTFSLTVVTLQLASSQYSPRLLRTFARDLVVQSTLALFLATFAFSLTVLRSVRSPAEGSPAEFVPRIAVTVAFVLAVASVLGLVVFLAHLARQLRVETILRTVHAEASATLATALPDDPPGRPAPAVPSDARTLVAAVSGFVTHIDRDRLLEAASAARAVVVIRAEPGTALVSGVPLGWAWSCAATAADTTGSGEPPDPGAFDGLEKQAAAAVHTDYERTAAQDITFGLRQLTDVAIKALSPGINDPTTAVHALDHISALLGEISPRILGPIELRDDAGAPWVYLLQPTWDELLDTAITQPRIYGAADPLVARRLFELLGELAWCTPSSRHPAIVEHQARLRRAVAAAHHDPADQAELDVCDQRVASALTGHWPTE